MKRAIILAIAALFLLTVPISCDSEEEKPGTGQGSVPSTEQTTVLTIPSKTSGTPDPSTVPQTNSSESSSSASQTQSKEVPPEGLNEAISNARALARYEARFDRGVTVNTGATFSRADLSTVLTVDGDRFSAVMTYSEGELTKDSSVYVDANDAYVSENGEKIKGKLDSDYPDYDLPETVRWILCEIPLQDLEGAAALEDAEGVKTLDLTLPNDRFSRIFPDLSGYIEKEMRSQLTESLGAKDLTSEVKSVRVRVVYTDGRVLSYRLTVENCFELTISALRIGMLTTSDYLIEYEKAEDGVKLPVPADLSDYLPFDVGTE